MSASRFRSIILANGCFLLFVQHHKHGIVGQACDDLGLHLALVKKEWPRDWQFVTCNDAPIGKVDLAEVCLMPRPDWLPIKRTG